MELRVDGTSGDAALEEVCAAALAEYFELWKKKQRDYGPHNISINGQVGVVVRINDKVQRLRNLILESPSCPNNEAIEDTWLDCLGYGLIGLLVCRGKWPMPPKQEPDERLALYREFFIIGFEQESLPEQGHYTDFEYQAMKDGFEYGQEWETK